MSEFCTCYTLRSFPEVEEWRQKHIGHLHIPCGKYIIRRPDVITTLGPPIRCLTCSDTRKVPGMVMMGNQGAGWGEVPCPDCVDKPPEPPLRRMPDPPGARRGHEPGCEALYGDYHCTCQ